MTWAKKGWKVTAHDLRSWLYHDPRYGSVQYVMNEWAKPLEGNGPLVVFTDFEDALRFLDVGNYNMISNSLLFECEYEPSEETSAWYLGTKREVYSKVPLFMMMFDSGKNIALADRVRLVREVLRGYNEEGGSMTGKKKMSDILEDAVKAGSGPETRSVAIELPASFWKLLEGTAERAGVTVEFLVSHTVGGKLAEALETLQAANMAALFAIGSKEEKP
jgi:hypothetical protein